MEIYTKQISLRISELQKETLNKLSSRNIKVSNFIRLAIKEKLERDYKDLVVKPEKFKINNYGICMGSRRLFSNKN